MTNMTIKVKTRVSTKAPMKLVGWIARPNMTISTYAVMTTKPSMNTPSTKPIKAPIADRIIVSLKI